MLSSHWVSSAGTSFSPHLPITAAVLEQIKVYLQQSSYPHKSLVWAVCCTAFFGFFWLGKLLPESKAKVSAAASLMWGDEAADNRDYLTMVKVHLKWSKCDQFGVGADVVLGRTGLSLCPAAVILEYIEVHGSTAGLFFRISASQPLLKASFMNQLREILCVARFSQHLYADHSFHIGAATTAALKGMEDSTIQMLGRWQSAAFLQYIRTPKTGLAELSSLVARNDAAN